MAKTAPIRWWDIGRHEREKRAFDNRDVVSRVTGRWGDHTITTTRYKNGHTHIDDSRARLIHGI